MRLRSTSALVRAGLVISLTIGAMQAGTVDSSTFSFDADTGIQNGIVSQFDPSLGTLTGISLVLTDYHSNQNMAVSNIGSGTTTVLGLFDYTGDLTLPNVFLSRYLDPASTFGVGCSGSGEIATCYQETAYPLDNALLVTPLSVADFSPYIGTGSLPISLDLMVAAAVSPGGTVPKSYNAHAYFISEHTSGVLSLRYTYDPGVTTDTPEPATLSLMGAGLFGLAAWMRRKRSWH